MKQIKQAIESVNKGDVDQKLGQEKYDGEYTDVIESINNNLSRIGSNLYTISELIELLSLGESLPEEIEVERIYSEIFENAKIASQNQQRSIEKMSSVI